MDDHRQRKTERAEAVNVKNSGMKPHKIIRSSIAAESIFHNIDLVTEVLLRLPARSLMRFKSLSKSWRTIITSTKFCLLWQQHQDPGLILMSRDIGLTHRPHRYIPVSGPKAGVPKFVLDHDLFDQVLQSCNGFLLCRSRDHDNHSNIYCVYNPTTLKVTILPSLFDGKGGDACMIHSHHCECKLINLNLVFDHLSHGRVVALARAFDYNRKEFLYQVYMTKNNGEWKNSGQLFECKRSLSVGVYWNNSIIWIGADVTLCFDVDAEVLHHVDASPPRCPGFKSYYFGESGGHLHFIQNQSRKLIIYEMMPDLSWFEKGSIGLSQIDAALSQLLGSDYTDEVGAFFYSPVNSIHPNFNVVSLFEDEKDLILVVASRYHVISYRMQDQTWRKLCGWDFIGQYSRLPNNRCLHQKNAHQHVETIFQFQD